MQGMNEGASKRAQPKRKRLAGLVPETRLLLIAGRHNRPSSQGEGQKVMRQYDQGSV